MARPRSELSEILHDLCENVYFQPPTGTKLVYPCIIYSNEQIESNHADNAPYALYVRYSIKYITRDPDNEVRFALARLPMCASEKFYTSDNLYHYPFRLYF